MIDPRTIAKLCDAANKAAADLHMDTGYEMMPIGQSRELGRAAKNFLLAFLLAFIFMYLVLAAQFESWIHPVTILLSLPLSVPFALFSLVTLRQSMNIFSTLGILVLFGIVKKNSILQVDHTLTLLREGFSRPDAIMLANRDRLRPILMTSLAFLMGALPLVFSSGPGAEMRQAMGTAVFFGMVGVTVFGLLFTPLFFAMLQRKSIPQHTTESTLVKA